MEDNKMSDIHEEQAELLRELNAFNKAKDIVKDFLMGYLPFDEAKKIAGQLEVAKHNCMAKLGSLFYKEVGEDQEEK